MRSLHLLVETVRGERSSRAVRQAEIGAVLYYRIRNRASQLYSRLSCRGRRIQAEGSSSNAAFGRTRPLHRFLDVAQS